jgi:cytochrome c oxidase cbb3-type subunit 3
MRRLFAIIVLVSLAGCQREERSFRPSPPFGDDPGRYFAEYERNAYNLAEGKRLYAWFNCKDCHGGAGGGAIGPPLRDARWYYGYEPTDIFTSISKGRPNGMPPFETKVPAYQRWQLVAYVRSLSGLVPKGAAPGRNDDLNVGPPENSREPERPFVQPPDPDVVGGPQ